jgi:tetratricopeptide (TPR) repeat protein
MNLFEQTAKINHFLAGFVAVLGALAWSQPVVAGSDLWWHLASGREIWTILGVHSTDPFSYTFGGREWLNHEWLWDVIYWGFYRIDTQAVAWLNLGLIAATFSLAFAVSLKESGSALAAGAMLWLAAASSHWFLDIRPHLITLLFVNIFLLTRNRTWAPWLWPPLVVLWANLHGGFVFGVGMIGLFALVRTIEASIGARRLVIDPREWISVGLCVLAMMANPWGYRILAYPLDYLDSASPFRSIIEWQPPEFSLNVHSFHGRYTIVCIVFALAIPLAALRARYLLALAVVTFMMAFTSRRFIPLFAITSMPVGALAIVWLKSAMARQVKLIERPETALVGTAIAATLALGLWKEVRIYPRLLERWTESSLYPEAALRYLKAMDPPRRVLNYYNWGGYILLHAPEFKLFIDGRANTLYDDQIYLDYLAMLSGRPGTRARAARYSADVALLPSGGSFARELLSGPDPWTQVYADSVARILLPPGSPLSGGPLPDPNVVLAGHPDQFLVLANRAVGRGDLDTAQRYVEQAIELNPLLLRAYGRLATIQLKRRDIEAVNRTIEAGLRESPRSTRYFRRTQGQAYERIGNRARALEAYRLAIPHGPFSSPRGMQNLIKRLESQLERGAARPRKGTSG